jgi:hypothetical protein
VTFNISIQENFSNNTYKFIDYENEIIHVLYGNTALLVLFVLLGAFGNCLVLYVYKDYKFSNKVGDRRFIPYLALMDYMASLTSSCHYLIENGYPLQYPGSFSCKVLSFASMLPASISGMILLAIAFHRYNRVCNPFTRLNFTQTQTIGITAIGGQAIFVPTFIFSDATYYYNNRLGIGVPKYQRLSRDLHSSSSVYSSFIAALCVGGIGFISDLLNGRRPHQKTVLPCTGYSSTTSGQDGRRDF